MSIEKKIDKEANVFSFSKASFSQIEHELKNLYPKKGNNNGIPTKLLKNCSESFTSILHNIFNNAITECTFPDELKIANITPIFKKGNRLDEKNYRPISLLPKGSKSF